MCARYREIPDIKFRQELGFGPIVNRFDPAPVLSTMMLPPPISLLLAIFFCIIAWVGLTPMPLQRAPHVTDAAKKTPRNRHDKSFEVHPNPAVVKVG